MRVIGVHKDSEGDFWAVYQYKGQKYTQVFSHRGGIYTEARDELEVFQKCRKLREPPEGAAFRIDEGVRRSASSYGVTL